MTVQQKPYSLSGLSYSVQGTISAFSGDPLMMRNVCRQTEQMFPGGSIDIACIEILNDIRSSDSEDWRRQCLSPDHLYLLESNAVKGAPDRFCEVIRIIKGCFPWFMLKEEKRFNIDAMFKSLNFHLSNGWQDFPRWARDNSPLLKNREIALSAVTKVHKHFLIVDEVFCQDENLFLKAVSLNGDILRYAVKYGFHLHKDIVMAAVTNNGMVIQYADDSLRFDKEVILAAVAQDGYALKFYKDSSFSRDKDVVLKAVSSYGDALSYAHEDLRRDKEVVLVAVDQVSSALSYAHEDLRRDKEVILVAVRKVGSNLAFAHEDLRRDKEVVLAAVKKRGTALQYAHDDLRRDREIVKAAVAQTPYAFQYADKVLRQDKEVVLVAINACNQFSALLHIKGDISSLSLLSDKDVQAALRAKTFGLTN